MAVSAPHLSQVTGAQEQVRSALRVLGEQLRRHPPRGTSFPAAPSLGYQGFSQDTAFYHHGMYGMPGAVHFSPAQHAHHGGGLPHAAGIVPVYPHAAGAVAGVSQPVDIAFRLLAPVGKAGNIIGRCGENIRRIRGETGARVKVRDAADGAEERLVTLGSSEEALAPYCAAQDALIRCAIALSSDEPAAASHRVRLLTTQASVGAAHSCLLERALSSAAVQACHTHSP